MKKHLIVIGIVVLLLVVGFSGCNEINNLVEEVELDPVIQRANPYINKIVTNDIELRAYANSIIKDCPTNDKECQINLIYRHIVENFNYLSDPTGVEFIQSPQETIQVGGGDCEDLSILFNSLLENVGIKTYLVLSDTHAYSLVYDVNPDELWGYIEKSFIEKVEKEWGESIKYSYEKTSVLGGNEVWYYGGDGSTFSDYIEYLNISYEITSDRPLHLYIVPSQSDYENYTQGKTFYHFPDYEESNVIDTKGIFPYSDTYGGVLLANEKWNDATVQVNLTFYFHPSFYEYYKDNEITYYLIDDKDCIVVDCTNGELSYPGYDAGIIGEKTAIDPITKEYTYLT